VYYAKCSASTSHHGAHKIHPDEHHMCLIWITLRNDYLFKALLRSSSNSKLTPSEWADRLESSVKFVGRCPGWASYTVKSPMDEGLNNVALGTIPCEISVFTTRRQDLDPATIHWTIPASLSSQPWQHDLCLAQPRTQSISKHPKTNRQRRIR
jgi:hypothetical protein